MLSPLARNLYHHALTLPGHGQPITAAKGDLRVCLVEGFPVPPTSWDGNQWIVRTPAGLETATQPLDRMFTQKWEIQQINMWIGYLDSVVDGSKKQTIRVDDPFVPGPAEIVFDGGPAPLPAVVSEVASKTRAELTTEDAVADGFNNLEELHAALDKHYPGLPADAPVDIVRFSLK